jgi:allophanate hydrolase
MNMIPPSESQGGPKPSIDSLRDVRELLERIRQDPEPAVWTFVLDEAAIHDQLKAATERKNRGVDQPLFGIPFAVKDNIDVAGYPTTAGCPQFAYMPAKSATAVRRLMDAGAIFVGKTNMDQFATGLVGTRSPYGACRNTFDPKYISGGSSSGSAVAVARGLVGFALGTDTAGSGRVPAAFNNIVGFKPTRGVVSAAGVLPACRSLDCVSVFAMTCGDAARVYRIIKGHDPADAYSRREEDLPPRFFNPSKFRFGVPAAALLKFFGNAAAEAKFQEAVGRLKSLGGEAVEIDYAPFARAARLLYEGPWVAERYAAVGEFIEKNPEAVLAVTRLIISRGRLIDAVSGFRAQYELESLRAEARTQWERMDLLLLPTTGTIYTIEEVASDPIVPNTNLGYYTNFVNLLDLCAVAVPNGFQPDGLPVGVSLIGPAGMDEQLLALGDGLHRSTSTTVGASDSLLRYSGGGLEWGAPAISDLKLQIAEPPPRPSPGVPEEGEILPKDWVKLAVVGAHLSGQPLNHQLTSRGGRLVRTCRTSADYRLYALPGTVPPKPGLIRSSAGTPQEVEVWALSVEAFGSFVAAIPAPLGVGTIRLEDGEEVKSFMCEQYATLGARDISAFGGWRKFLQSLPKD